MGAGADQVLLGMPAGASDQLQPPHQQQKPGSVEEQRRPMRGEGVDLDALALAPAPESSEGEFPDEDAAVLAGEEAERGNGGVGAGGVGNRWPREETLALLRIRSDMDAAFRDASLKGPLWEDVSRKLAEQGYKRSAKKCREKFENVHKYYKRTREGRAGRRHDGKSYKFFTQLEALDGRGGAGGGAPAAATIQAATAAGGIGMVGSVGRLQPTPLNAIPLAVGAVVAPPVAGAGSPAVSHPSGGVSFSSNDSAPGSSEEDPDREDHAGEPRKRKSVGERDDGCEVGVGVDSGGGGRRRRKMVAFFDGLMRQVVERQEAMQQKLLEMIEKREQDRMIREEAWRRQEMALLAREHEAVAQERQIAAARDATIIAFLQKVTAQTVLFNPTPIPPAVAPAYPPVAAQPLSQIEPAPPPPGGHQPQAQQLHGNHHHGNDEAVAVWVRPGSPQQAVAVAPSTEEQEAASAAAGGGVDPASSRWPKSEVFALIKLRSEMESKCLQETAGPKGAPLWEEIAAGMRRMGYSRSAKRCKEKWENINKYFKKVKDSSKKRTEDAKTCPYFHQLDALYRRKVLLSAAADNTPLQLALPQQYSHQEKAEAKSNGVDDGGHVDNGGGGGIMHPDGNGALTEQARRRNGGTDVSSDETSKEPEDAVRRPADRRQHAAMVDDVIDNDDKTEETESDSMEDDDEEKTDQMEYYRVEYHQRPATGVVNGAAASNGAAGGNSFAAMVQ